MDGLRPAAASVLDTCGKLEPLLGARKFRAAASYPAVREREVAGVIGLSTERGDQLVVETLPSESTLNPAPLPALGLGAVAALLLACSSSSGCLVRKKGPDGRRSCPPNPAQKQAPPVTKRPEVLRQQAKIDSAGMAHVLRALMAEPGDYTKRWSNSTHRVSGIRKAAFS